MAEPPHPWVSRGGVKLARGARRLRVRSAGRVCLDVGASTGGFTDVLLARGAARVYAVDVGRGQLHAKLARDPRVTSWRGRTCATSTGRRLPQAPGLVLVDVSFISLQLVLPAVVPLLAPGRRLVALIKPQFEAGRRRSGAGASCATRPSTRRSARAIAACLAELGSTVIGTLPSPVAGGDGNREFLIGATVSAARRQAGQLHA